jgi:N utilization substance protein A
MLGGCNLSDFRIAINQICNQRRLPKEVIVDVIEAALVAAYKKNFGPSENVEVKIDPDTGQARVFIVREIVEKVEDPRTEITLEDAQEIDAMAELGGTIEEETKPRNFGRIAAQTAKQVILQRIREAERDLMYTQYIDREGEIINGVVRNIDDRGNVILSLGKAEAILQRNERIRSENYRQGQRLRTFVLEVQKTSRGPQILVSRTHRQFLRRLLELEVPEIFNGTVEVKAIAREPGSRSKVAVAAMQEGIDPVGSCVGVRGVRIQNVVTELSGEKIDVVAWDEDPGTFVANALSPAKVARVEIDEDTNTATVIVPDNQLSLSIGKEGQNARLAAKLTGWRIDIKSISEAEEEAQRRAEEEAARAEEEARREAAREEARALLAEAETLIEQEEQAEVETAAPEETVAKEEEAMAEADTPSETVREPNQLEAIETEEISLEASVKPEPTPESEAPVEIVEVEEPETVQADSVPEDSSQGDDIQTDDVRADTVQVEGKDTVVEAKDAEDDEELWLEEDRELAKKQERQKRWHVVRDPETGELIRQRRRKRSGNRSDVDWQEMEEWEE